MSLSAPSHSKGLLAPGEVLATRYRVTQFLTKGSSSEIYVVQDELLDGQELALKLFNSVVSRDPRLFTALQQEVLLHRTLRHPNILQLYEAVLGTAKHTFLTMEYVDGCPLSQLVQSYKGTELSVEESVYVFIEFAAGISYLHQHSLVHRNIQSQEVLISRRGDIRIKGCGRQAIAGRRHIQAEGTGENRFCAPENLHGGLINATSNQFSLGALLYSLLVGKEALPKPGEAFPDIRGIRSVPTWVGELVNTCLQPDPEKRFESVEQAVLFVEAQSDIESLEQLARERLQKRVQDSKRVTRRTRPSGVTQGRVLSQSRGVRYQRVPGEFRRGKK